MNEKKKDNVSFFGRLKKAMGVTSGRNELNATDAFFKTKYGDIASPEQYIAVAQKHILRLITSRMEMYSRDSLDAVFRSYYCLVDFDSEMGVYADEIFKPFIERGFSVINLSDKVDEISSDYVYAISWDRRGRINKG